MPTVQGTAQPRAGLQRLACQTSLFIAAALGACASPPAATVPALFLNDAAFAAASEPIDAARVFALSDSMRRYAATELASSSRTDPRRQLILALQKHERLRLSYDAATTRDAAEAFEARAGNCLSLVIMTAAFARHLGLPVSFQSVLVDEQYSRSGNLLLSAGHVNLVLGRLPAASWFGHRADDELTVDFLPSEELRGQRTERLQESSIIAMYMNNRAAEALAVGRTDDSYWWAREALRQEPSFLGAANTLAVIYQRRNLPREAETALRHVLTRDPDHTAALSNLVSLLRRADRVAEADAMAARLSQLQPVPPFHFFELGRRAMGAGDYRTARSHFASELKRQPHQDEVHFWAALAHWHLGDEASATRHLRLALENSLTRNRHELYAATLDRLRASRVE